MKYPNRVLMFNAVRTINENMLKVSYYPLEVIEICMWVFILVIKRKYYKIIEKINTTSLLIIKPNM